MTQLFYTMRIARSALLRMKRAYHIGLTIFFFNMLFAVTVQAQSDFRPGFKETVCKLEAAPSGGAENIIGLGLRYSERREEFLKKVKKEEFRFANVAMNIRPEESEVYFYWRPTKNYLFLFGHSNSCVISDGVYRKGAKGRKSEITYSQTRKGCCIVYQESSIEVVATPLSAVLGKRADDLRNTGYIMGWYDRKDCSKPTKTDPDFVQSFIPDSGEPSLSVVPNGPAEALLRPINMGAPRPLRISSAHGGSITGVCKAMPHTFAVRPPPAPYPRFDALPPFPERKDYRPSDDEKDFVWEPRE